MNRYYCDLNNFQTLIKKFKEARRNKDQQRVEELKSSIEAFRKVCGVPYSDEEITTLTSTFEDFTLRECDIAYLRNAPNFIIRSLQNGHLQQAEAVLKDIERYVNHPNNKKQKESKCQYRAMVLGFQNINGNVADVRRLIGNNFPETCTQECPHTQCSSWGIPEMQGKPCRNHVQTNQELEKASNPNEEILRSLEPNLKAQMFLKEPNKTLFKPTWSNRKNRILNPLV